MNKIRELLKNSYDILFQDGFLVAKRKGKYFSRIHYSW